MWLTLACSHTRGQTTTQSACCSIAEQYKHTQIYLIYTVKDNHIVNPGGYRTVDKLPVHEKKQTCLQCSDVAGPPTIVYDLNV